MCVHVYYCMCCMLAVCAHDTSHSSLMYMLDVYITVQYTQAALARLSVTHHSLLCSHTTVAGGDTVQRDLQQTELHF